MRIKRSLRIKAFALLTLFVFEIFRPSLLLALTDGPASPEFSSFEPVSTTDMINLATGDFTYNLPVINIPGSEGSDYALSLSYHSGVSMEQEASWVGYGWTLNPGAINRQLSGLPDDYKDNEVIKFNKNIPNWTATRRISGNLETYSNDATFGLGASKVIRYNNYKGFTTTTGFNANIGGYASLGFNKTNGEWTVDASIRPGNLFNRVAKKIIKNISEKEAEMKGITNEKQRDKIYKTKLSNFAKKKNKILNPSIGKEKLVFNSKIGVGSFPLLGSYGFLTHGSAPTNTGTNRFVGRGFNNSYNFMGSFSIPIGIQTGYYASFSMQLSQPATYYSNSNGYLYTKNRDEIGDRSLSDYSLERENQYSQRSIFLPIPFHTADNFGLTGEGLSGGFRFYKKNVGHYYPALGAKSSSDINTLGWELIAGPNIIGFGTDISLIGESSVETKNWKMQGNTNEISFDSDGNAAVAKFNGDLGGEILYSTNTNLSSASVIKPLTLTSWIPGFKNYEPELTEFPLEVSQNVGRSSYIENKDLSQLDGATGNSTFVEEHVAAGQTNDYNKSIAEFSITNPNGHLYTYGLPVYNRNELSFAVDYTYPFSHENPVYFNGQYVWDKNTHEQSLNSSFLTSNKVVMGEMKKTPYSGTHLLTNIVSPNYYDLTNNGPTDDDLGGYTRFDYKKLYGEGGTSQSEWYKWRMPYTGSIYEKNGIARKTDDIVQVSSGEKEVYYLKQIETKTHIAFFVTNNTKKEDFEGDFAANEILEGSHKLRLDGFGAQFTQNPSTHSTNILTDQPEANTDPDLYTNRSDEYQPLEYLEKIVLYSKASPDRPIKVVNFEYDYSLVKNTPNNMYGNWPGGLGENSDKSGKLTLKKVWFDYGGIYEARTAPYTFHYEYFDQYPSHILEMYPDVNQPDALEENPLYDPYKKDAWGGLNFDGFNRLRNFQNWLYQGQIDYNTYDPAAWNLKRIQLPSGGEIHIQYEEKDYAFVQDKKAMGMVGLRSVNGNTYELDLGDIGIINPADAAELERKLHHHFVENGERIYYKFLYPFSPYMVADFSQNSKAEYVDGYAKVNQVYSAGNSVFIVLNGDEDHSPRKAAYYQFLENNNGGNEMGFIRNDAFGGVTQKIDEYYNGLIGESSSGNYGELGDAKKNDKWKDIRKTIRNSIQPGLNGFSSGDAPETNIGTLNKNHSYLRIPLLKNKRGGGIRVKRLLSYDPGIINTSGEAKLYGNEYIYELEDGLSSGVTTNEPNSLRFENPLTQFLKRGKQKWINRITYGKDKEEAEGPVGEYLLPSPSIIYSRVTSQNIANYDALSDAPSKTGTGFKVDEFYTAKDYPFGKLKGNNRIYSNDYTELGNNNKRDLLTLPLGLFNLNISKKFLSQGYVFYLNNFHGVPKSTSTYGGYHTDPNAYLSSAKIFEYYEPGEKVPLLKEEADGSHKIWKGSMGREVEMAYYMDKTEDNYLDINVEVDISIAFNVTPTVTPSFGFTFNSQRSEINRHVTNKVVTFPVIQKGTKAFIDGAWNAEENLAFDPTTGTPLITKTYDGYNELVLGSETKPHDGSYYTTIIPGHWKYAYFGQKAKDPNASNQVNSVVGNIISYGDEGDPLPSAIPSFEQNAVDVPWLDAPKNVISANVTLFKDQWYNAISNPSLAALNEENPLNLDFSNTAMMEWLNKQTYPVKEFVYREVVRQANDPVNGLYNSGMIDEVTMFNWNSPESNSENWFSPREIDAYDYHGRPFSDHYSLVDDNEDHQIYSSVRFGYDQKLPTINATNSNYYTMQFQDFEMHDNGTSNTIAHTGKNSFKLHTGSSGQAFTSDKLILNEQLIEEGLILKAWIKSEDPEIISNLGINLPSSEQIHVKKIAQTGEWILIEGRIDNWGGLQNLDLFDVTISYEGSYITWLDDFRLQPSNAQTNAYVYDPGTYRLMASLDDQNFALMYQYNDEGKLVRKIIETEQGIKTITETQYHNPKKNRN